MATTSPESKILDSTAASTGSGTTATDIVRAVLAPLASLKLTVFLLGISVFVVWLITLDQVNVGIWDLKEKHFFQAVVVVPYQTLLPPKWFPNVQNIPGGFYIPSGITLITLLLINLSAAHLLRFRIQARGARLIAGIVAAIAAALFTWAIIFAGRGVGGFQESPPISYGTMWTLVQIACFGVCVAALAAIFSMSGKHHRIEKILLWTAIVVVGGTLVYTIVTGAFLGDAGMRVMWQLVQSTIAALAGLAACLFLFKRRAGIVLLHIGLAGMMANEVYVTVTNVEQNMSILEGKTVSHTLDTRATELAIIDRSDSEYDEFQVVPGHLLQAGDIINDASLPFRIQCLEYYANSELVRVGPVAPSNLADAGIGQTWIASELPVISGTEMDQTVDYASAYVRIMEKDSDKVLGTFLANQRAYENGIVDSVNLGDKTYVIGLRFKHIYKPYSVTLKDVQKKNYVGTSTAKWFSSDIEIQDFQRNGLKSDQRVWMNNPLRYGDETFYQSGYHQFEDGSEQTSLQVVKNRGWMIPYVCCMFVVVGLMAQLGLTLLKFLRKPTENPLEGAVPDRGAKKWVPILFIAFFALYAAKDVRKIFSNKVTHGEIRLDLLGEVPVTYGGRVKPLDSLARNTARKMSNREFVYDGNGVKQPAIRWLADMMFEDPGYMDYQIIRVEDLNVQNALGLPRRKGMKYTLAELQKSGTKLVELLQEAEKQPKPQWTDFQNRLRELFNKYVLLGHIQRALAGPPAELNENPLERVMTAGGGPQSTVEVPLLVAHENTWVSLEMASNRQWLATIAEEYSANTPTELANAIVRKEMIKSQIISVLLSDPKMVELFKQHTGVEDQREIERRLLSTWDDFPKDLYKELLPTVETMVDSRLVNRPTGNDDPIEKQIRKINGKDNESIEGFESSRLGQLVSLKADYGSNNGKAFNEKLEAYLADMAAQESGESRAKEYSAKRVGVESSYNAYSPFYVATVIYLGAFLISTMAWIGWHRQLNHAAFWTLVIGLTIHVLAIVARVYISERPPVTNLYSSFSTVAAVVVLVMLVVELLTRIGIGNVMGAMAGAMMLIWAWTLSFGGDTHTVLVAVLDTQFWLSTHVMCITIGYAATIVAGMLGVAYLIGSLLTDVLKGPLGKKLVSVVYGMSCFAILFSFFGTVLGGLWADDSWGRFWGWDPKENGALMIVLWNAVILHARWGGIVRQRGIAALATFGIVITLWSWEGVNRLGVGLHAYAGVTAGAPGGSEGGTIDWLISIMSSPDTWLKATVVFALVVTMLAALPKRFWQTADEAQSNLKVS